MRNDILIYGSKYYKAMDDLAKNNSEGFSSSYGGASMQGVYANVFKSMADNTNVEWRLDRYADGKYQIGTIHQEARAPSTYKMTRTITGSKDVVSHPSKSHSVRQIPRLVRFGCGFAYADKHPQPDKHHIKHVQNRA